MICLWRNYRNEKMSKSYDNAQNMIDIFFSSHYI